MPNYAIKKSFITRKKLYDIAQTELKNRQVYLYESRVGKWSTYENFLLTFPTINEQRFIDIPSRPLVSFLRSLLVNCIVEDNISYFFWLPHPTLINVELLWEKIITYLLSPKHVAGREKFNVFTSLGLSDNFESANILFEYFCNAILNQNNVMSYEISEKGISATFLDCVVSQYGHFVYIKHIWSTRFFTQGENAGMIDGFANLTTAVLSRWDGLNKEEQAWLLWKRHQRDPKSSSRTSTDLIYLEKIITVKAVRQRTDFFDGPEAKKGPKKGKQNERVRKFKAFKSMKSPFANEEPLSQEIIQTIRSPNEIPSSSENPLTDKSWLIDNQLIALQNKENLSVLQPEAPFNWESQIALPAGPSEKVYLEAHFLSSQDDLTTYIGNSPFPKEQPFYGINNKPGLPQNYEKSLEDYNKYKNYKHDLEFDFDF
jgi:hypothetical protein